MIQYSAMAIPCEMLLHPELLTNEQLIQIIQERHLRIQNLHRMARDELLDLFHQFCVPFGQRKYRDSGRGKILNKIRPPSPEPVKLNTFNTMQHKNNINRKSLHSNCDRLKPPPDLLSGHMKRIKLENKEVTSNIDINISKRKMSVDAVTMPDESPPTKKERKLITWP